MADPKTSLERLIEEHGGVLIRQRKHKVFRFPTGAIITVSSTPEDPRGNSNALACMKNVLGLHPPNRGTPGERREKRIKRKFDGSTLLPPALHDINTGDLKTKLAAVKPHVPKPSKAIKPPKRRLSATNHPHIEIPHLHFGTRV